MEGREILLTARASECALSRRLNTQAMHGGIKVRSTLKIQGFNLVAGDDIQKQCHHKPNFPLAISDRAWCRL